MILALPLMGGIWWHGLEGFRCSGTAGGGKGQGAG